MGKSGELKMPQRVRGRGLQTQAVTIGAITAVTVRSIALGAITVEAGGRR